jgi:hypothetical protein
MKKIAAIAFVFASAVMGRLVFAQEGPMPTQLLVGVDSRSAPPADASVFTVEVDGHREPATAWEPLVPGQTQLAVLIDDGLRESVGREMDNLKSFIGNLPPGVEVLVGFMQYGRVVAAQGFTADHAQAAASLHLPQGVPGASASPYLCLSEFVKHWPGHEDSPQSSLGGVTQRKARTVLMITNGVDPYNGSTSVLNQDSPYVKTAITDAQRAGVQVYALYFSDAGMRSGSADNSGQNYLGELTQATGGVSLWEGIGNPVSMAPFLKQFQQALAETHVVTFSAPAGHDPQRDLVRVKVSAPHVKLRVANEVLPGNRE